MDSDPMVALRLAPTEGTRRWAAVFQRIVEVDPLKCPHLPRRDAPRHLHHATVHDRPDPRAPPHSRHDGGPRRRAESSLDPRTVWTGRHATTRRGPPGPLSLPPTPRPRAGTCGVRVRSTGRQTGPRWDRASTENAVRTATEARRRAEVRPPRARRPSWGQRSRRTFTRYSPDPD